jgi:hypothetical protein
LLGADGDIANYLGRLENLRDAMVASSLR